MNVITCTGLSYNNIAIPAFTLMQGDYMGVELPIAYDKIWDSVIRLFSGENVMPEVSVHRACNVIDVSRMLSDRQHHAKDSTLKYLTDKGVTADKAIAFCSTLGLSSSLPMEQLQLTPLCLINLRVALAQHAHLLVLSTSGLDPSGFNDIATAAAAKDRLHTILHLFSSGARKICANMSLFTKVIRCEQEVRR